MPCSFTRASVEAAGLDASPNGGIERRDDGRPNILIFLLAWLWIVDEEWSVKGSGRGLN